jgi:hypothetical protein
MSQFISELSLTFPEEPAIRKGETSFELMRKSNPRKCVDLFMEGANTVSERIMNKDDTLFTDTSLHEAIGQFNIDKYWMTCSEHTKDVVWQYLSTLYMLGTTITSLPSNTLSMIENVAEQAAESMKDGSHDPASLMKMLGNLMK